jgi:hypothetical protein
VLLKLFECHFGHLKNVFQYIRVIPDILECCLSWVVGIVAKGVINADYNLAANNLPSGND